LLTPALVRGLFGVFGSTSNDDYVRWVCGDPALERRFQRVLVRELSADETLDILRARVERLERHHNVVITDVAVRAAVELTDRYETDRMRPDRAIDALDEACAHAHARAHYSPETEALIREVTRARRERSQADQQADMAREHGTPERTADEDGTSLEALARQGFAAIERFGLELEAALGDRPRTPVPGPDARPAAPNAASPVERPVPRRPELEVELARRLVDEGIVVRGHDVARVVGLMSGKTLQWPE
jgi:ATP-dependent Clp protease ATP-binding subunit ClpA